jgi:hypothetical protein
MPFFRRDIMDNNADGSRKITDLQLDKEKPLDFERDWDRIKQTQLDFLPESERENFLIRMVKMAVYN